MVSKTTTRELAKNFIAPYVKRGDTLSYLCDMGASTTDSVWVTIGGYAAGKKYSNDFIVVSSFKLDKVLGVFKKRELYDELAHKQPEQLQLI